jgi:hypothetical protein
MTITNTNKIISNNYIFAIITIAITLNLTITATTSSSHFDPRNSPPPAFLLFSRSDGRRQHRRYRIALSIFLFYDSTKGIFDTLKTCAQISKTAGGIGMHCSNIRATGSYICGTNGQSNGLVPMLRRVNACLTSAKIEGFMFEFNLICAVQSFQFDREIRRSRRRQASRRVTQLQRCPYLTHPASGAFAIYLEPWHADVEVNACCGHARARVHCYPGVSRAAKEPRQRGTQGS